MKKLIRSTIKKYTNAVIIIKTREMARDILDKKLFIESIVLLKEIEDRRDFMEEELGVDMSIYEEKFLQVIENLFRMYFNKEQMSLIQYYLYQVPTIENWDGMVDISDGKNLITVKFETPAEVWDVVHSLKP